MMRGKAITHVCLTSGGAPVQWSQRAEQLLLGEPQSGVCVVDVTFTLQRQRFDHHVPVRLGSGASPLRGSCVTRRRRRAEEAERGGDLGRGRSVGWVRVGGPPSARPCLARAAYRR